jgi:hypothetical protein
MSFAIFDENYYLANNPDVKAAVDAGTFSSGRQHFEQYGLAEGRVLVSPYYDEQLYLQKYPDVADVVSAGSFRTGLQHYIQYGEAEGRSPGAFDEAGYLLVNTDVAAAVAAGTFSSGLQHYIQFGQFEAERGSLFSGTSENDTIAAFGQGIQVVIGVNLFDILRNGAVAGVGEVDTLIGAEGRDGFFLGFPFAPQPRQLYVGEGNNDYGLIQNFEQFSDAIVLSGSTQDYNIQAVNGNLNISTASGDLIGIVEGVTSLSPIPISGEIAGQLSGLPSDFFMSVLVLA